MRISDWSSDVCSSDLEAELSREEGWRVYPGRQFSRPVSAASAGIKSYLPIMVTDIILENTAEAQRIVIDTKFTSIITHARYGGQRFKTDQLYQLYAYLRTQERTDDPISVAADGMLRYPAIVLYDWKASWRERRVQNVEVSGVGGS